MTSIDRLARDLVRLEKQVAAGANSPQLQNSTIEGGALQVYNPATDQRTMVIGTQWDGTYTTSVENGPQPPQPSNPIVTDGTESLTVLIDGTFVNAAVVPMDFLRYDIHIGLTAGFVPSHLNRYGTVVAPTGGSVTIGLVAGTYYVKVVCWSQAGVVSLSSDGIEGDSWPVVVSTDGFPPSSSPDPTCLSGIEMIEARWTPITNADPVHYEVHISTTLGFTATPGNAATLAGTTTSSSFWIHGLPGPDPAPGDPDTRTLQYDVPYYIRIIAIDDDGAATQSLQGVGSVFQVTGVNLAADSVTAAQIVTGTLTGELFAASVIVSGVFKTAETGQRIEFGIAGIQGYRSDGSLMINFPTEDGQNALFDGELVVRGATVIGGMSIQSDENELTADAALTLMRGITSPSATPAVITTWDSVRPSTTSLTAAQKTNSTAGGLGGPFELEPSAVSQIEWKSGSGGYWVIHQIRSNGTRSWFFNPDGTPKDLFGTGKYFNDVKDWEIWSTTEILSGAKAGVYTMFRFLPGTDWYVNGPVGFNHYTRTNTSGVPALGNNGTDLFIAENINGNQLRINYHSMASYAAGAPIPNLPGAGTTYTSSQGYAGSLCHVSYNATGTGGFDVTGTIHHRYATAERGVSYNARLLQQSGSGLFPGGAGGWAASDASIESWESPTSNRRGMAWDGTNFWTYGGDGLLYKHTSERWDPAATSSKIWAQITFKDTDAGGTGTHETKPGPAKYTNHARRAKLRWTVPPVPDNGGTDDPNAAQLYMARGATQPANAAMWAQGSPTASGTVDFITLSTSGTNPPTINTFPAANPARLRNDDDTLVISGDGTFSRSGATARLMTQCYTVACTAQVDLTTSSDVDITGATQTFTTLMPNARYVVFGSIYWAAIVASNGLAQGKLSVDGTNQGATINFTGLASTPSRENLGQCWSGTLAAAGSHTIKLRAAGAGSGTQRVNATSTTLTIMIFE